MCLAAAYSTKLSQRFDEHLTWCSWLANGKVRTDSATFVLDLSSVLRGSANIVPTEMFSGTIGIFMAVMNVASPGGFSKGNDSCPCTGVSCAS